MQGQPATIKYETTLINQNEPGERQTVSCTAEGTIQKMRDAWYIRYSEPQAEGLEGTNLVWKLTDKGALLLRRSSDGKNESIGMRQEFQVGQTKRGHYDTPFGRIDLATTTHVYKWRVDELERFAQLNMMYETELMRETNQIQVELSVNW